MITDTDQVKSGELVHPGLLPMLLLDGQRYAVPGTVHYFPALPNGRKGDSRPSNASDAVTAKEVKR